MQKRFGLISIGVDATLNSTKNRGSAVANFKIGHFLVMQGQTATWRPRFLGNEGLHAGFFYYATKKCFILKFVMAPIFVNICHFWTFPFLL